MLKKMVVVLNLNVFFCVYVVQLLLLSTSVKNTKPHIYLPELDFIRHNPKLKQTK